VLCCIKQSDYFSQAQSGTLELIGCRELRCLTSLKLIELGGDVSKVSLEIFLHRATVAVPFRALIG
jgi:hypothetical protein